eukprot:TRINITY_DN1636_c0_g1_i1.p1 TRINITY_DN1636_c0_g1~~TRINITY_DN1636_c0_g1_i1.p1  ORF type:complete len:241 (+),score=49.21 TRINITY_DN1636_c0_g1_i1:109-831(+)
MRGVTLVVLVTCFIMVEGITEKWTFPPLDGPVEILKDDANNIVDIFANNDHDLYFASGYAQASQSLFIMDVVRRAAQARVAELTSDPDDLLNDQVLTFMGIQEKVDYAEANASPAVRSNLEDFAEGVNYYLANDLEIPFQYALLGAAPPTDWKVRDSIATIVSLGFSLITTFWQADLLRSSLGASAGIVFPPQDDTVVTFPNFEFAKKRGEQLREQPVDAHILSEEQREGNDCLDTLYKL